MKTILYADNDPDFLVTRAEFLELAGYHVIKAFTLEEARRYLDEAHVHFAIFDIRLVNDDDSMDISGLTLAGDPVYRRIPKIVQTGFPSVQAVKDALGPVLEGLPPAVDFVAKADGPDNMIKAVEKAFAQFVRINWDLEIQWDRREPLSFPYLATIVKRDLSNDPLVQQADELEDLFRRLFYKYQRIRIGRLLWNDGCRFCVSVLACSPQGVTDSRLLVCGDRECLEQERKKIERLALKTAQGISPFRSAETTHFCANIYELPGADIETVQTLRDLFKVGKERSLKAAFDHLLGDVLKAWHQHGQTVQEKNDLMFLFRQWVGLPEDDVAQKEIEQRVESLVQSARTLGATEIKLENEQVMFHFPRQSPHRFPDPVATVYTPLAHYDAPVICKISPGRLTADSILVDSEQHVWLTDFAQAGQAPQWWDFICLEAAIRFDLSQAPDLLAWQEFEECLVKPNRLDEKLEQSNVIPELRTSVALIEQVRQQAASETGPDPLPYYAGLLAWAVEDMAHYDPGVLYMQADRLRGAHLLLAASMLAERLGTVTDTAFPEGRLRLDEDGRVWIGERRVATLAGLSQKLLACLFEHESQVVNNRMIVEAYGEKFIEGDSAREQSIRQEVSRLRENTEPNPKRPRYILTERGKGYRLKANGKVD